MILVDTSLWIDYFNGIETPKTNELDRILSEQSVIVGDLIFAEILQGFDKDHEFKKAKAALSPLSCVRLGGKSLAIKAASNFRFLQSKDVTIRKTADMFIGSWCIEHNVELFHNDIDFDRMAEHLPLKVWEAKYS